MNRNVSWRMLMETRTEERRKFQTPALVAVVVALHVVAVGSVALIQGCGTVNTRPRAEAPPAPVMPPQAEPIPTRVPPRPIPPPPVVQQPVVTPIAPAPVRVGDVQTYEVKRGDNLSTIARRHGVSTAELVDLNNLRDANSIRIGQKLLLPPHARAVSGTTPAPAVTAPTPAVARPTGTGTPYVIQAGDNLSSIASRHGVTVAQIVAANQMTDPNRIRVGQSIIIPAAGNAAAPIPAPAAPVPAPVAPVAAPAPILEVAPVEAAAIEVEALPMLAGAEPFPHPVRMGDTLDSLARDYSTLKSEIMRLNNLSEDAVLRPGQTVLIPSN